jgi:hypothetical protein
MRYGRSQANGGRRHAFLAIAAGLFQFFHDIIGCIAEAFLVDALAHSFDDRVMLLVFLVEGSREGV